MNQLFFCEVWAGLFYFLNKVFFLCSEIQVSKKRKWKIYSWLVYLVGLPGWLYIFYVESNWIVGCIELGGAPAMLLGLIIALRGRGQEPHWLNGLSLCAVGFGFILSMYDFGGITTLNQVLESGVALGFLIGTYLLARENQQGYLFFLVMNASNAGLMYIQNYSWLCIQQCLSFIVIACAYYMQKRTMRL